MEMLGSSTAVDSEHMAVESVHMAIDQDTDVMLRCSGGSSDVITESMYCNGASISNFNS